MKEYLLVDGYNIIHSWEELAKISEHSLDNARKKLADILCNYQGISNITIILVFDAYNVKDNPGSVEKYNNITIIFTKEAETADQYIEKSVGKLKNKNNRISVATSDYLEQIIIISKGGYRISASDLKTLIETEKKMVKENYTNKRVLKKNALVSHLDQATLDMLENMRRGKGN